MCTFFLFAFPTLGLCCWDCTAGISTYSVYAWGLCSMLSLSCFVSGVCFLCCLDVLSRCVVSVCCLGVCFLYGSCVVSVYRSCVLSLVCACRHVAVDLVLDVHPKSCIYAFCDAPPLE
jgi:hypothetical protein